ncbi:hypothetical protein B0H19DRAFT_1068871 [Mycena capillaripes]|nr:hypothetical protein B0H19DRAFT_1068871 [Mycena capillaripes]
MASLMLPPHVAVVNLEMAAILQELVEVILADFHPVDDRNSLKSIALAATNFAEPAQRVMFRSLALQGHDTPGWCPTFERALNLFNGLHTLLSILPIKGSPEHLELVLPRFSNVWRFIIRGVGVAWDDLEPGLKSTLATFLSGPSLEKLHLSHILGMPLAIIAIAAQTIPMLSLQNIFLKAEQEAPSAEELDPSSSPRLTHLILSSPRGGEFDPFQKLMLPAYIANIQRLFIERTSDRPPRSPYTHPAIAILGAPSAVSKYPPERFNSPRCPWHGFCPLDAPGTASDLSALDDALGGTVSRLVWDLAFTGLSIAYSEFVVVCVRAAVKHNMVRMHEASAIEVTYSERRG